MLFMGEEYGERRPFQFFSDHIDPEIAEATREGRATSSPRSRSSPHQEIPDPQDPATFERSKLTRGRTRRVVQLYRELLRGP